MTETEVAYVRTYGYVLTYLHNVYICMAIGVIGGVIYAHPYIDRGYIGMGGGGGAYKDPNSSGSRGDFLPRENARARAL